MAALKTELNIEEKAKKHPETARADDIVNEDAPTDETKKKKKKKKKKTGE